MTFTTKIVAASAGLALSALMAGTPVAFADAYHAKRGHQHHDHIGKTSRVTAFGAAPSGYAARSKAFANWRHKVAHRYGPRSASWWRARHKSVSCTKGGGHYGPGHYRGGRANNHRPPHIGLTKCQVSAVPSRGWGGYFGWNRRW